MSAFNKHERCHINPFLRYRNASKKLQVGVRDQPCREQRLNSTKREGTSAGNETLHMFANVCVVVDRVVLLAKLVQDSASNALQVTHSLCYLVFRNMTEDKAWTHSAAVGYYCQRCTHCRFSYLFDLVTEKHFLVMGLLTRCRSFPQAQANLL